ncbi:MAG: hypothetical protein PF508_01810 [Spirochaeta sp.]|nr:hypothetical protein [Spirochaeta sp.]
MNRPKPQRFSQELIVQEDRYTDPAPARLKEELTRINATRNPDRSYPEFVRAFHDRKYASDFARELNRSAEAYVRDFS